MHTNAYTSIIYLCLHEGLCVFSPRMSATGQARIPLVSLSRVVDTGSERERKKITKTKDCYWRLASNFQLFSNQTSLFQSKGVLAVIEGEKVTFL